VPSLFVIRGNDQGSRFELGESIASLGRDVSNLIQLHDTEVSRRHAELVPHERTFVLNDLSSSNGTFVNGRRIETCELNSGDQVQMGGTLMLFTAPGDESDTANLSERINIIKGQAASQESRILHAISREEDRRLFDAPPVGAESPWLARARGNLQIMYRTALAVSHTLDLDQLLDRIMQLIFEWVQCDRGCAMLLDSRTGKLVPKVRRDRMGHNSEEKITISQTILDYVLEHDEGVLTSNASEDERWNPAASILQMKIREAICVPMRGRYGVVGVIYIDTSTPPERAITRGGATQFKEEHLKLMVAVAHQAALAVEDTNYYSAMVQAERLAAIGQTIATLSHHIKNILQGIRGGSYLIEMGLGQHDEEIVRKGWNIVERNQKKISALVLDMLTFSKEREPELLPGDVNEVVGEVVELMRARADELGVELDWQADPSLPTLTFDPDGIHRAVLNIVTNALDACEKQEQGHVHVKTGYEAEKSLALVSVEDNGPGIPAEDLQRIFTVFVSGKGNRGTGLGLSVSDKIMKEHGGRILVTSTPGEGTCFTLELPAVLPQAQSAKPSDTT